MPHDHSNIKNGLLTNKKITLKKLGLIREQRNIVKKPHETQLVSSITLPLSGPNSLLNSHYSGSAMKGITQC